MNNEIQEETGFNSITDDNKHVILWDFDNDSITDIIECLKEVQKYFKLSDIYIIASRNGYNAVCLDKYDKNSVLHIKTITILSDRMHNFIGWKRDGWVLRMGDDKKLETIVTGFTSDTSKSNAHRILLEKVFDIKISKTLKFDNFVDIVFEKYIRKNKKKEIDKRMFILDGD